jgi:hypothetical protein
MVVERRSSLDIPEVVLAITTAASFALRAHKPTKVGKLDVPLWPLGGDKDVLVLLGNRAHTDWWAGETYLWLQVSVNDFVLVKHL